MSEIVRIAARGEGVTADGRHFALAAPGDQVGADDVITAGPHRRAPACRHFPLCGGCQLQHVDDAAYAGYLVDRIAGALAGQGLAVPEIVAPHLSPPGTRRRASLRAMRAGGRVLLGFNERASNRIVDIGACPVLDPALFALVVPLRQLLGTLMERKGVADIRMTLADQGVDLTIAGVEVEGLEAAEALARFGAAQCLARLSVDEGYGAAPRWEPQPVTVTLGGVPVALPEGAFLQATADGEAALVAAVREAVGEAHIIADLFSGLGTFAFALDGQIHAAEGARDAVLALQAAANRAGRAVAAEHRDLYRRPLTPAELARFDAVVLDPPRAGALEQVTALAVSDVPRIAYVSCNPATFARDAKLLTGGGYRLDRVNPVGQFRWSTHIELAAAFTR